MAYDAAREMLGRPWRMPTNADLMELFEFSIFVDANGNEVDPTKSDKRVVVNGTTGLYLQSRVNGLHVFFPCSGFGDGLSWNLRAVYGNYWSSTFLSKSDAQSLNFNNARVNPLSQSNRYRGYAIRPIWNPLDLRG